MIYLASPYTDPEASVREWRFDAACERAAQLMLGGDLVYCAVAHGHPLVRFGLPGSWPFWAEHDLWMLARCTALRVLTLPGWRESQGVAREIEMAKELGLDVGYEPWPEAKAAS